MSQPPKNTGKPSPEITGKVLKLITNDHPVPPSHHTVEHEEEEKIEVDERWLIAYADKMTLLCGLFVMLFAASNIDKTKFQKVKESAEKSFGKATSEKPKDFVDIDTVKNPKAKEPELLKTIAELNTKTQFLEYSFQQKDSVIESQRKQIEELLRSNDTIKQKSTKMEELDKIIKSQRAELTELKQKTLIKPILPTPPDPNRNDSLRKEIDLIKSKLQEARGGLEISKQEKERLVTEISQLKEEIERLKQTQLTSTFLSVIMSWPTAEHDVDLSITDPNGKTFDFKHRKYQDHPGTFVLDTRRGPGNEVWQAEKIIPGIYRIKYFFYNQYGNKAPCTVKGTLVTPKGSFDLPETTLDLSQKREVTYTVDVDRLGNVKTTN